MLSTREHNKLGYKRKQLVINGGIVAFPFFFVNSLFNAPHSKYFYSNSVNYLEIYLEIIKILYLMRNIPKYLSVKIRQKNNFIKKFDNLYC